MAELTVVVVVVLFLGIAFFLYLIMIYNGLVLLNVNIGKAWANIDVLLKQRHDEIPNLIAVVQGYKEFEKKTITDLTAARTAALSATSVGDQGAAQKDLTGALGRLMAVAENYPQLKAQENFLSLQKRLSELESEIADRRSFYNASVAAYNTRISQFPDLLVAGAMKLKPHVLFQAGEGERDVVKVGLAS
jgi:LemA protein